VTGVCQWGGLLMWLVGVVTCWFEVFVGWGAELQTSRILSKQFVGEDTNKCGNS